MIYLVRHGETEWNALGRFQGRKDSALTAKGLAEAESLGRTLARLMDGRRDAIAAHVSPLGRARKTAEIMSKHILLDVREEPRLAEISLGSWDGLTRSEIEAEYPGCLTGATSFDWFFRSPDGESLDEACARLSSWLRELASPTVAVTHGITSRLVRGIYLGLPQKEMLELPIPQGVIYSLRNGAVEVIT